MGWTQRDHEMFAHIQEQYQWHAIKHLSGGGGGGGAISPRELMLDRLKRTFKTKTGEVIWQERIGGNFSASPVEAAGRLYLVDDSGQTTVIEAAPAFKVLAKNPLGEKVQASPALSQGQVFIRTEKHLFCIAPPRVRQ